MKDLQNPKWIYLKAVLFVFIGLSAAMLIYLQNANLQTLVLVCLLVWSMCRAYYFAFYVIERYVDSAYNYSGLYSLLRYWFSKKRT